MEGIKKAENKRVLAPKEFEEDLKKYKADLKVKAELERQELRFLDQKQEGKLEDKEEAKRKSKKKRRLLGLGIRSLLNDESNSTNEEKK